MLRSAVLAGALILGVAAPSHSGTLPDPLVAPRGAPQMALSRALIGAATFPTHQALVASMTAGVIGSYVPSASQQGYNAPGDGGAAVYDWNPTSIVADDGVFTLRPADLSPVVPGRFMLRIPGEGIHPEVAGAVGDGTTDDSGPINSLSAGLQTLGGGTILATQNRFYNLGQNTTIWRHVNFKCPGSPQAANGPDPLYFATGLRHPPGVTLTLSYNARMEGCAVLRTGLAQKPASVADLYAQVNSWFTEGSNGVEFGGNDTQMVNNVIIGFTRPFHSEGMSRQFIQYLKWDGPAGGYIGGGHDTFVLDNLHANNAWGAVFDGHQLAYTVSGIPSNGSGYAAGSQTLTVLGGACTSQPKVTATGVGGQITGVTAMADVGDCTAPPANPVSVSGGTGTGATLTVQWQSTSNRPGEALTLDGTIGSIEGGLVTGFRSEAYQIGIHVKNAFGVTITNPVIEGDPIAAHSRAQIGIAAEGCASQLVLLNPYVQGEDTGLYLHPLSTANGGVCGAAASHDASVAVVGGTVGFAAGQPNAALIDIGSKSQGTLTGVQIGGPGGIVVQANAGAWTFSDLQGIAGFTIPSMLHVDPTSIGTIRYNPGDFIGHLGLGSSAAPVVSACGTSPTGLTTGSTDTAGEVIEGSSSTGCTVTFATPWPGRPFCIASTSNNTSIPIAFDESASVLSITHASANGLRWSYRCAMPGK